MSEQRICASHELRASGLAVRFDVVDGPATHGAFVVRFGFGVYAYLNRCSHMDLELDWSPGDVFDRHGALLICATHGALYDPTDGACRGGPCRGIGLTALGIVERAGDVYLADRRYRLERRQ